MERGESIVFAARDVAGTLLGFAQMYPLFSSLSLRRAWLLNDLFVAPEARGRRIAGGLLRACEAHARATGAESITLETAHGNRVAQRVYEAHGWMPETAFHTYVRFLD
jgi:GNAT superfamily N-acetyltransferase